MSISTSQLTNPEAERPREPRTAPRVVLTREGERTLKEELEQLRQRLDGEFSERLREARGFGGSTENDEYLQIKEEEAVIAARIRRLEGIIATAEVIDDDGAAQDIVAIGSVVEVRSLQSGRVRKHRLTGGFGLTGPGEISANSPVGQALLGRKRGETVTVELPNGRSAQFEILTIGSAEATAPPSPA